MHRRFFLLRTGQAALITSLSLKTGLVTAFQNDDAVLLADVEKLIPRIMKESNIPGLSAAIIRNGKVIWNEAYGVKDNRSKEPVNVDTVFEAASVSKTAFAYAVMKLCEKGTLKLDEPLTRYLPKPFLEGDPGLNSITARHVLSHQTGFQNWRTPEEPLKINFTPGSDFMYSGEGYYYLQSVVTQLTGKVNPNECGSYEADVKVCATDISEYMIKNVLVPHGMTSSGYAWTDALGKNVAMPHNTQGEPQPKGHPTAVDMARYASAGGLHTTAKDFSKFIIGLFTPKENDPYKLNRKSLEEMFRPQVKLREDQKIDGASSWALGWAVQERKTGNVVLHSGGQSGFKSLTMVSIERKSGFVMLTNSDNGGYLLYNEELGNVLNRLFGG
ncbi:MAG TPA: serine hydrolase domain-containing protein [Chryseolinea sp.]|nr:serine hydrolase domain-containing protein [Chryseolinea sp.]